MSYLVDSARKLGRFFASPDTPLGKRRARCNEKAVEGSDETPPSLRKRICTSTVHTRTDSVTQNAADAVRRARHVMTKETSHTLEQDIQDELAQQTPEDRPAPKTVSSQWSTQPNTRARKVLADNHHQAAALIKDLQEPEYACHDAEIRDAVWKLQDQIEVFAEEFFSFQISDRTRLRPAFESMSKETVKIIGYVASGGPAGVTGWEDVFLDSTKRQALVCAIIGNVLVEQVLQHIFFGGTEEQIKEVAELQSKHSNADGFTRTALYATAIRRFLTQTHSTRLSLPSNFNKHLTHLTAALLTHLAPIFTLSLHQDPSILIPTLHALTTSAALFSLSMRLAQNTAYHFHPAFKHQPLTSEMESFSQNQQTGGTHARVQISLFPSVSAYRRGGWETPSSTLEKVEYEDGCQGRGVRVRRLTDAWVYCQWGGSLNSEEGGVEFLDAW